MKGNRSVLATVAIVVVMAGLLGAFVIISLMGQGDLALAMIVALGAVAVIGSLASLEMALLCMLVLSFTDGMLKGLDSSGAAIFAKDIFMFIGFIRWGWLNLTQKNWSSLHIPLAVPAALFIIYCSAEVMNTSTESLLVGLAGLRSWIVWIPAAFIGYRALRRPGQVHALLVVILVLALLTGAYGILQYRIGFGHLLSLGTGFAFYNRYGWDENSVRATSTFVSPGAFGGAMSLVAIIALASAAYFRGWFLRSLAVLTGATCLVGLACSASRAPLLGLIVGVLALLLYLRRARLVLIAAIIALVCVTQLNQFASGAFERRYNEAYLNSGVIASRTLTPFSEGFSSALDHPLGTGVATGVGLGRGAQVLQVGGRRDISAEAGGYIIENEYGRALRELGIPGTVLFLWLLITALRGSFTAYRKVHTPRYRMLAGACAGISLSIVTQLAAGSALYVAPGGLIFWLFYALALRLPEMEAISLARAGETPPEAAPLLAEAGARPLHDAWRPGPA